MTRKLNHRCAVPHCHRQAYLLWDAVPTAVPLCLAHSSEYGHMFFSRSRNGYRCQLATAVVLAMAQGQDPETPQ